MMYAITAGLSGECLDIIKRGLREAYGGIKVDIKELAGASLKREIRLAGGSSCVLVVLDEVNEGLCQGIDKGVLSSQKYLGYTDEKTLIDGLNSLFSINLEYKEVGSSVLEDMADSVPDVADKYEAPHVQPQTTESAEDSLNELKELLKGKDMVISNLTAQLSEARSFVPVIDDTTHKDELLQYKRDLSKAQDEVHEYRKRLESLETSAGGTQEEVERWKSQSFSLERDMATMREKIFQQETVLRNKDSEIKSLNNEVAKLRVEGSSTLKEKVSALERDKARLESELESLRQGVPSDALASQVSTLTNDLNKASQENKRLTDLVSAAEKYRTLAEESEKSVKEELGRVQQELLETSQENVKLNLEVTSLQGAHAGSGSDDKLREVQEGIFYQVGEYSASPGGKIPFPIRGLHSWYENITFVFSGSAASEHGTYKELLYRVENSNRSKHLIVDLGTETSIDYVMSLRSVKAGVRWLREGGAIAKYLTATPLKGVNVLSMGVGYFNDSYLLTLDWAKRLDELNSLGSKVYIYCGGLGSLVGRMLLDAFKGVGEIIIVNKGTLVSMRSLIVNMMGVDVPESAELAFFEYNDNSYTLYSRRLQGKYRCTFLTNEGVREDG